MPVAAIPPWRYGGYDRFPSLFFGARNGSNPIEPDTNLEWITKHQLVGFGYQHAESRMREESSLQQVAMQTKDYARAAGLEVATFVYRDAQLADPEYVLAAAILNDTNKSHWWLRQNGTICTRIGQFPQQRQFNFSVPEARDYFVDVMVAEVAGEDEVDAVFFDEADWTFHAYRWSAFTNCPGFDPFPTEAAWAEYRQAKADLLSRTVVALNQRGKVPLLSASGGITATSVAKCPNRAGHWAEEEELVNIRERSQGNYIRYYESWMGFGETDPDCWANWLKNAMWETSKGLPFIVRWDMGMFNGTDAWLEFGMAAFLMAQGDYCYFGAAADWYDRYWRYHEQYDWQVGPPLGPALQIARYRWRRDFERCTVSVDLERAVGVFRWL